MLAKFLGVNCFGEKPPKLMLLIFRGLVFLVGLVLGGRKWQYFTPVGGAFWH